MNWPLPESDDSLKQVVAAARSAGPQIITSADGAAAGIVLSIADWQRLQPPTGHLADFLMNSPLRNSGLVIERDQNLDRPVSL